MQAEAGTNQPLSFEVVNRGEATDQFEVEIEGLDPEWTAVPVPRFSVSAHDTAQIKVFFKPGRSSENIAGNYPFVLKVRSLESGEVRAIQGTLNIKPYFHLTMEMNPKKGIFGPTSKSNSFTTTIVNLSNTELTLQLYGSEPEDALAYEFSTEQVVIGPGQQKEVEVQVTPTRKSYFASSRLFGFTVSARSLEHPSVVAAAQAQLEQRAMLSPGALVTLLAVLLVVVGWFSMIPKAPSMDTLTVDKPVVLAGETVTVRWTSSNAKSVKVEFAGQTLASAGEPDGSLTMTAQTSGEFVAIATRDNRSSGPLRATLEVTAPPEAPAPEVEGFEIERTNLEPGEKFFVKYKVKNAIAVTLAPTGTLLHPAQESIQIEAPSQPGTYDYQLTVSNATGQEVTSKIVRVTVALRPKAKITTLTAEPAEVDPASAKTTITWKTTGAARCELKVGSEVTNLPSTSGSMEIDVFETTDVVFTAYDEKGLTTKRTLKIKVKPVEPPSDDHPTPPASPTGTTGGTGSPTGQPPAGAGANTGGGRG